MPQDMNVVAQERFAAGVSSGSFDVFDEVVYGTGWGGVRGLLASAGLSGATATVAHLGLVWGSEQVVLPALNVSAPVFKYGGKATAADLLHHTVYAAATGLAYSWLDRSQSR